jgi:hypothetical protein
VKELDPVVLNRPLPEFGLEPGDVGTVVHVHADDAWEVEFVTGEGSTVAVTTLRAEDVRPIAERDILHVRSLADR